MPATTRTPMSRPPSAPAWYLARPAIWWLTAARRSHQDRARVGQHLSPGMEAGQ